MNQKFKHTEIRRIPEDREDRDRILSEIVKKIDPKILLYCKDYFENKLLYLWGDKLELTLVIDANIIISDAIAYIKNGKSFLLDLSKSPFLRLVAPSYLKDELEKKIPEVSKKKKIDENTFRINISKFLEKVSFMEENDENTYRKARDLIGKRDEKDVPYVALYLLIKAHGILTRDKDILDIPEIKTWKGVGVSGKVVSLFEKGAFSFLIIGEGLPLIFRVLYEICVLILGTIWNIVKTIREAIYNLFKEGVTAISKFPDWIKRLICVAIFFSILSEKNRNIIIKVLQTLVQQIINILKLFYKVIKDILTIIAPLIEVSFSALEVLFLKIKDTINMYQQINSQAT
ncbi:MAG: hypothetical protein BWK75_05855 [Candidatus Altiarchaeales archaeon A3]|nr:MAG: hypothetical protein BWK75_05855 [Candidatus Altiarchaeales archaeon A3]